MDMAKWMAVAALALGLGGGVGSASAAQPGKDYLPVNPVQGTETGNKVEVLEVFSYACPHCDHLAPSIEPWAKKLPPGVVYRRMPVTFGRPQWIPLARAYYALEAMGEVERLHEKIFAAIHQDKVDLGNEATLFDWVAKQGVDKAKFIGAYNSFAVQSKVQRSTQKTVEYGIDGVPSVIVDGKFRTAPSMTGGNEALLGVLDDLIKLSSKDHTAKN